MQIGIDQVFRPEEPQVIRNITVIKNLEDETYEFHFRGLKIAAVSTRKITNTKQIHDVVDNLHRQFFTAMKFLNNNPEARIAPISEATPESLVESHADL